MKNFLLNVQKKCTETKKNFNNKFLKEYVALADVFYSKVIQKLLQNDNDDLFQIEEFKKYDKNGKSIIIAMILKNGDISILIDAFYHNNELNDVFTEYEKHKHILNFVLKEKFFFLIKQATFETNFNGYVYLLKKK